MTTSPEEPTGWPEDAVRDRLIGDWSIYQRAGGHRTSTDDLICAWYAVHRNPQRPARYLDLGCGVGSVMLMVCHKLAPRVVDGVEAQSQSALMAERSVRELAGAESAIYVHHSDFRNFEFDGRERYDLVTGSPPYFPLNSGVLPSDPQRLACRFEARGGVEDYLEAAASALADGARFYLVFQTRGRDRVLAAASKQNLHLSGQADFLMRRDKPEPFLSVFEFAQQAVTEAHRCLFAVRESDGEVSDQYMSLRRELGVA